MELLSPSLLGELRPLVEEFKSISKEFNIVLGWHYLLDVPWAANILNQLPLSNARGLDAGAGRGMIQWWLARQGAAVISADRSPRTRLPRSIEKAFVIRGLRRTDFRSALSVGEKLKSLLSIKTKKRAHGKVLIYNQELCDLADVEDNSLDFVVSISALEHNSFEGLVQVLRELMRVLKPGAPLVATVGASSDSNWFHEPSKGWCYNAETVRHEFGLPADCDSNYDNYDSIFEAVRDFTELRVNLHKAYFKSGENGMPWGKWDPQYLSVGVVTHKRKD